MEHLDLDFGVLELREGRAQHFDGALHVGAHDQVDRLHRLLGGLHHRFGRHRAALGQRHRAILALAFLGDFLGLGEVADHVEGFADAGQGGQTRDLDRRRRRRAVDDFPAVVVHRAHLAVAFAGQDHVAADESSVLHEQVRDDPLALLDLGFEHDPGGRAGAVALELEHFALEEHALEQLLDPDALERADLDHGRLAAPGFRHDAQAPEGLERPLRVRLGLVDFRQRDDDRGFRRARVRESFLGLLHRTVVGGDDEDDDVDRVGAARAHGRERGVTGRVDDRQVVALSGDDLVGADVLRDAAGLAVDEVRAADRVDQRGLAVVDVAEEGDGRRAQHEAALLDVGALLLQLAIRTPERGGPPCPRR